jgi:hypothetical protein
MIMHRRLKKLVPQLKRAHHHLEKYADSCAHFCTTPIEATWLHHQLTQADISAQVADYLREVSAIEIPKKKGHKSNFWKVSFQQHEEIGEVLSLDLDPDFHYNLRSRLSMPVSLISNNFWLWRSHLVYFDGQNPDGTPRNPRICFIERKNQTNYGT